MVFQDNPVILEMVDLSMPFTLIVANRQRMLLRFVVCNMLSHKWMRMSFRTLCNDIFAFFLGLFCRRNGEWYFLFLRVENRCTWNWNRWWFWLSFYISYMFVHTLGFKKQGCIGIIEDCFVSQQHLMEEAPSIVPTPSYRYRFLAFQNKTPIQIKKIPP